MHLNARSDSSEAISMSVCVYILLLLLSLLERSKKIWCSIHDLFVDFMNRGCSISSVHMALNLFIVSHCLLPFISCAQFVNTQSHTGDCLVPFFFSSTSLVISVYLRARMLVMGQTLWSECLLRSVFIKQ